MYSYPLPEGETKDLYPLRLAPERVVPPIVQVVDYKNFNIYLTNDFHSKLDSCSTSLPRSLQGSYQDLLIQLCKTFHLQ